MSWALLSLDAEVFFPSLQTRLVEPKRAIGTGEARWVPFWSVLSWSSLLVGKLVAWLAGWLGWWVPQKIVVALVLLRQRESQVLGAVEGGGSWVTLAVFFPLTWQDACGLGVHQEIGPLYG